MKTKHRVFTTTAEANAHVPLDGEVFIDAEKKAIRFGLGGVLGGYEALGSQAVSLPPGPQEMVASFNDSLGYYGEVPTTDFIDGAELASLVGLSVGDAVNTTAPWLKFKYNYKTLYVAKKNYRVNLSWEQLYQLGLVYGRNDTGLTPSPVGSPVNQMTTIEHNGIQYIVRLMLGATKDPADYLESTIDPAQADGTEWNRLMYHVSTYSPSRQLSANWAENSGDELDVSTVRSWVQETRGNNSSYRITRGGGSGLVGKADQNYLATTVSLSAGWRPVLEPVE